MIRKSVLTLLVIFGLYSKAYAEDQKLSIVPFDVLYHGSPNPQIEILEPRQLNVRDNDEGAVIFASPSIKVASCFLFPWDDSWVNMNISSEYNNKADFTVTMVISNYAEFTKRDKGGAIYLVPIKDFIYDENKGLGLHEWTNKNKMTSYGKILFTSSLEAMKKSGVKVYFVSPKQFEHYLKLPGGKQQAFLNKINQTSSN
jgi:hypothetical protein